MLKENPFDSGISALASDILSSDVPPCTSDEKKELLQLEQELTEIAETREKALNEKINDLEGLNIFKVISSSRHFILVSVGTKVSETLVEESGFHFDNDNNNHHYIFFISF